MSHYHGAVIDTAIFNLDGDRIMLGRGFMSEIDYSGTEFADYSGQPAECVRTDVAWKPGYGRVRPTVAVPCQRIVL